jgi:transcriptional regulator with XRE-family HTH domain
VAAAFGLVLRRERQRAGLSQEELAFRASMDRTFVSRAERGERQPALATVLLLAEALGIPAATLVDLTAVALERGNIGPASP